MRLKLKLEPKLRNTEIPLSYNYFLSSAIYYWIEQSSPTYSKFLHEHGFSVDGNTRQFKHFCFSNLNIPRRNITNSRLVVLSAQIEWYIGMPVEETLKHLVIGIFEKQEFYIEREENIFTIAQVEALPEPEFVKTMKFQMLSPLTISIPEERNGKILPHYLRPDDERLSEAIKKNILNKYHSLNGNLPENTNFDCSLDEKFIHDRGGPERISKLITIKEGHKEETRVRGFMCPITIEGNPKLIKLAYESGLGEKGSLGFGMIEVIK
ncbi:MAG: CRISPR-associated endoribonuclease Cas6 [Bacteroidota bacterium]|nr:CRISPR-associated endoribonuclease Cas6 [Bacteroidota bacterium]